MATKLLTSSKFSRFPDFFSHVLTSLKKLKDLKNLFETFCRFFSFVLNHFAVNFKLKLQLFSSLIKISLRKIQKIECHFLMNIHFNTYSPFGLCSPFGISNIEKSSFTRSRFCASCMPYMKYLEKTKSIKSWKPSNWRTFLTCKLLSVRREMDNLANKRNPLTLSSIEFFDRIRSRECERRRFHLNGIFGQDL